MQSNVKNIFLLPVGDGFLLHAPLHGVTSLVNGAVARELQSCIKRGTVDGLSCFSRQLGEALLRRDASPPPLRRGPFSPAHVSLLPTNGCNMRCVYCAPSNDNTTMPREICEAALSYQATVVKREGLSALAVYYFGGEPFLAWDLVQFSDRRGRELAAGCGVPFRSECATNAFMPEEHARWVAGHLSFALVSLDGPPDLHNSRRPAAAGGPTYDTIVRTLHVFEAEGLPYALRCNVDSVAAQRLPEIAEMFCSEFNPVKINLEPLVVHDCCSMNGLNPPEPDVFANAVIEAAEVARKHGIELRLTTAQPDRIAQSNCAVAEDGFIVALDGMISACYMANGCDSEFAPDFAFGEIEQETKTVRIDSARLNRVRAYGVSRIPRCAQCFAKWHCSGGCRIYHTPPGCERPSDWMCQITQRLTLWCILESLNESGKAERVCLGESGVAL